MIFPYPNLGETSMDTMETAPAWTIPYSALVMGSWRGITSLGDATPEGIRSGDSCGF